MNALNQPQTPDIKSLEIYFWFVCVCAYVCTYSYRYLSIFQINESEKFIKSVHEYVHTHTHSMIMEWK